MSGSSSRPRWRDDRGTTAVEFAFALPMLLLLLLTLVELGGGMYQALAIEKGLRGGALFAARSAYPLPAATMATVTNLVRTGTVDGSGALLAAGWADPSATLSLDTFSYTVDGGSALPVYRLTAAVPYAPLLPGLMGPLGLDGFTITLTHEQAVVGD